MRYGVTTCEWQRVAFPIKETKTSTYCQRVMSLRSENDDLPLFADEEADGDDLRCENDRSLIMVGAEIRAYCQQYIRLATDEMVGRSRHGSSTVHRRGKHMKNNRLTFRKVRRENMKSPFSGKSEQLTLNGINETFTPRNLNVSNTPYEESLVDRSHHRKLDISGRLLSRDREGSVDHSYRSGSAENRIIGELSDHHLHLNEENRKQGVSNCFLEDEGMRLQEHYSMAYQDELLKMTRKFEHELEVERDFFRQLLLRKEETILQMASQIETLESAKCPSADLHEHNDQDNDKDMAASNEINIGAAEVTVEFSYHCV